MSIGLMLSTVLGIVMVLRYGGDARIVWIIVVAGLLIPAAVMLL